VPRHSWIVKYVLLYNYNEILVAKGICHSVKYELVVGSTGQLGDTHVEIQISKNLKADEFPEDRRYSARAWPITHVFYNGASLFNHG
jgi:hypothetical protein